MDKPLLSKRALSPIYPLKTSFGLYEPAELRIGAQLLRRSALADPHEAVGTSIGMDAFFLHLFPGSVESSHSYDSQIQAVPRVENSRH